MDLYKEILTEILSKEKIHVVFPDLTLRTDELIKIKSCEALTRIKEIIENDSLNDAECFMRIEEIIRVFENIGSSGGNRHDF